MEKKILYLYAAPLFLASWNPLAALYIYILILAASFIHWIKYGFLKFTAYEYAISLVAIAAATSATINPEFDSTFLVLYIAAPAALIGLRRASCVSINIWRLLGSAYILGCALLGLQILISKYSGSYDVERYSAFDLNANYLAYCLTMGEAAIIAIYFSGVKNKYLKISLTSAFALFSSSILLTGSRGAILATILLLIITIGKIARSKPIISAITLGAVSLIGYYSYLSLPDYLQNRLINGDDGGGDISSGRFDTLTTALDIFLNNFFLGVGPGALSKISPEKMQAHNAFASVFAETGFFGGIIYVSAIMLIFYSFFSGSSRIRLSKFFGLILLVTWFPIAMTGVWEVSLVAWMLFGWFTAFLKITNPSNDNLKINIR